MSTKKPASLTSSVISTKGHAAPSAIAPTAKDVMPPNDAKRIAVTVRLPEKEYRKLKIHGLDTRKSNQEIIVEALAAFLK